MKANLGLKSTGRIIVLMGIRFFGKRPWTVVRAGGVPFVNRKEKMKEQEDIDDEELISSGTIEEARDAIDNVRDFFNMAQVQRTIRIGASLFDAIYPAIDKPTWLNIARAGLNIGKIVIDDLEIWSEAYFAGDEWTQPFSNDFNKIILRALSHAKFKSIRTAEKMYTIRIIEHKGLKFGYIHSSRNRAASGVYVETEKLGEAREEIKKLLWDTYKDASLIMRCNRKIVLADNETRIVFEPDNVFESMASKRAEDYSRYMQKCLNAGVARSVMFYGPPGTGKSTIARTIVDMLKLRSFRIRVEDVGDIETSTIFEAIEIFQPDAIILDDFDRSHTQASLLETLEFFKYRVKLVIATVNNRNLLDEAILRPGRFDELIEVKQMDEEIVKKILGETMADAFEVVKDWPIAFVQEYTKRRMFMTPEEAEDSTRELAQRVKRLEKYDNDEPNISGIYRTLKKSKKP